MALPAEGISSHQAQAPNGPLDVGQSPELVREQPDASQPSAGNSGGEEDMSSDVVRDIGTLIVRDPRDHLCTAERRLGVEVPNPDNTDRNFRLRITSGGAYGFRLVEARNIENDGKDAVNKHIMQLVDQAALTLHIPNWIVRVQAGAYPFRGDMAKNTKKYCEGPCDLNVGKLLTKMVQKQHRRSSRLSQYKDLYVIAIRRTTARGKAYYYPELQKRPSRSST
ncbi:hypothetical protein C8T65DRAFT_676581 [Cerioporus squamosus]|nr:hypothetical protein C8T65DRAFT_676581 [Cerioporus squamosus]